MSTLRFFVGKFGVPNARILNKKIWKIYTQKA